MGSANGLAVDLRDVAKTYPRRVEALRGIEMRVHRGEIFGLLGPNGAGKTTLVKIMMTAVRPDRAAGTVLGRPIGDKPTLRRIGYLPEHVRFPGYLTGRQAVEYYGALGGVDRSARTRRSLELLDTVGLTDAANNKVSSYSKGMQQRLGFAQALITDPEMVLLDEPAEGIDPFGRRQMRKILVGLREQGKTVFLNTHLLGELEMICDRIAILTTGCVIRQGSLDELTKEGRYYAIDIEADDASDLARAVAEALNVKLTPGEADDPSAKELAFRGRLPQGAPLVLIGSVLRVEQADAQAVQPVLDALRAKDLTVRSLRPVRQSLEDLFVASISAHDGRRPGPPPLPPMVSPTQPRPGGQQ